ncbi:uncharacterized protein LOC112681303 [Sipha flava]|uniref:Uncharacterized protein LOC112681303 n=1 Tax=Sipha flava TaxID=143950 RepID=A0A8B8F995_9HEMI|nr:uncharacterized protein LOC112681303 [Sipha flava]
MINMSIINWIYKTLGIDNSSSSFDVPSEYKLSTKEPDLNMNFGHNDFEEDSFENNLNKLFHLSFEEILKQFEAELEFSDINESIKNNDFLDQFNAKKDYFNQVPDVIEYNTNKIPKKNFLVRNYFLKQNSVSNILNEPPIRETVSPQLYFGQSSPSSSSSTRTFISGNYNGRRIEKETSSKQLQGGLIEKVIVMRDGNQKCVTTIIENVKTGEQNCQKNLVNLDESQLNEFENRFSKFK